VRTVVDTRLKTQLAAIFESQGVALAYLFGSQAKGEVGPLSDIDVAVYFDESVPREEYFDWRLEVSGALTDLFKTDKVDLVVLNEVPPLLAHRIVKEGVPLFCRDEKIRIEFEVRAVLNYLDWKPYVEKYTRQTLGSGADHDR
jgi:predicted nucleotidyltransferase